MPPACAPGRLSHVDLMDVPTYPPLAPWIIDAVSNIATTLEELYIILNAIAPARIMGSRRLV